MPVAAHDGRALHAHLADLAHGKLDVGVVEHAHVHARTRVTGRRQALGPLARERRRVVGGGHDRRGHRGLALRVQLDEPRAEHLERTPEISRRERRTPVHDPLQGGERGRIVTDVIEQHHDLRGHHPGVGHAFLGDEVEDGRGFEPWRRWDHLVRAARRRRERVEPGTV